MSHLVLARKWRPQNFDTVVGQQPVVRILRNALKRNRVAHAMLFSGVRGVGKTTLARIMAKALNCQTEGVELPCDQCQSCLETRAGNSMDLHEIDGASNRGIQEIRDLKENIRFRPASYKYKIIIIDEVHMLTAEAFNALLKTLEEPPSHVVFMFATTEIHKIPVTILSRCQRYELKRVPFAELFAYFKKGAESEGVELSDTALEMITREAGGSVRDGLSLLEQVLSFGEGAMSDDEVRGLLGLVGPQVFEQTTAALLASDLGAALEGLDRVCQAGADLKRFMADLLSFVRNLVVCRVVSEPAALLDGSDRELASMTALAGQYEVESFLGLFSLLLKGAAEMQHADHPRLVLEMIFARATQTGNFVPVTSLIDKLDQLIREGGGAALFSSRGGSSEVDHPDIPIPKPPTLDEKQSAMVDLSAEAAVCDSAVVRSAADPAAGVLTREPEAAVSPPVTSEGLRKDVRRDWDEFVGYVRERRQWMASAIKMCAVVRREGSELVMKYDDLTDCRLIMAKEHLTSITEFAQDFFQEELTVRIKVRRGADDEDPAGELDGPQEERRALRDDPLVQMVSEVFSGGVEQIRTGPRSRVPAAT